MRQMCRTRDGTTAINGAMLFWKSANFPPAMEADNFDAFEQQLQNKKRQKKEEKKSKKKDKKEKKRTKLDPTPAMQPPQPHEDMSDLFRVDTESTVDRRERKRQERAESELRDNTARAQVLVSRLVNPEALLTPSADEDRPQQEGVGLRRVLSGLALARQMAQQQQQQQHQGGMSPVDSTVQLPRWKVPAARSPAATDQPSHQQLVIQGQSKAEGVREAAAALRARLQGGVVADVAAKPAVRVVQNVNERGEVVVVPRAAAAATTDSVYGLAQEERGMKRQDSMRELKELMRAGDEYEEIDGAVMKFGTGDERGKQSGKQAAKKEIDNAKRDRDMSQEMIRAAAKAEETLAKCFLCQDTKRFREELVVARTEHSYLCVLPEKGLHLLHCMIVPSAHITSMVDAEAALLKELDMWKGCLIAMLRACRSGRDPNGLECVFVETVIQLSRNQHTYVECVPLPVQYAGDIGIHFTKAIQEEGEMWSTNPKLVKTFGKRLHNCVPKDFPYVHVEWNRDREASDAPIAADTMPSAVGGLLHVIDDDKKFNRRFARDVLGGIMQLDRLQLKSEQEPPERIAQKVAKFKSLWAKFDWTKVE